MMRRPWWRLVCLMRHRGVLSAQGGDACALRMARHLAAVVGDHGVIADVPEVIRTYTVHHHVSERTAWADLGRLVDRGLLRQLQAAAPGYAARYRLCAPTAVVAEHVPAPPPELASCVGLQTSPSTREGHPPSRARRARLSIPAGARPGPGGISNEERDSARALLRRCAAAPPLPARIESMTAVALRHVPPGELQEILTDRLSGARDVAGVLAWRLGRVITAARRRTAVRADETGARYRTMLAECASRPGPGAGARAEIERARAILTRRRGLLASG
jgi:hypothetical protein